MDKPLLINFSIFSTQDIIITTHHFQGIIQEFNLGIGSHMSITLWCEFRSWLFLGGGGKPPLFLFRYISLLDSLIWNTIFVDNSF